MSNRGKRFDLRSQKCQEKEKHRAQLKIKVLALNSFTVPLERQISHQNIRHREELLRYLFTRSITFKTL